MKPLEKAISIVGGRKALAAHVRRSPEAIRQWLERRVPAELVLEVETATGGLVSRHELRPDLYPSQADATKSA